MEKDAIAQKVREIFVHKFQLDPRKITLETSLNDLGVDSLDLLEVIMDFEDEFHVTFENEELQSLSKVDDVINILAKKVN